MRYLEVEAGMGVWYWVGFILLWAMGLGFVLRVGANELLIRKEL